MSSLERTLIEIVAFLAMVGGFALYERHQGAVKCVAADVAAVTKEETHEAVKAATHAKTINEEAQTYANTVAAPDPIDSPHVSLCHYTPTALPSAPAPRPLPHEATPSGKSDPPPAVDVGPPLVKVGVDVDAQVKGLQDYIRNVCLVK